MFNPESKPQSKTQASESIENQPKIPSISLPKGGGAIRGIGEKFAANPVTGTGSLSVPVFTSPGRSGFGPQLSISYDSGAGNGIFGFGWNLSLPSITRKTDKGLPQYRDLEESDVFILSGAEDLVPVGSLPSQGNYSITKYRPRIEGLFARIERWTDIKTGDTFWRSISKDNITTIYGKTPDSRISDPENHNRIFSWLISESYDDKGNVIYYEYIHENSVNIDTEKINEKNRNSPDDAVRSVNRYLRYIRYGNKTPYKRGENLKNRTDWMFELVFDYCKRVLPLDTPFPITIDDHPWDVRKDPFSSYRSCFEIRTYRLCHRILMFHHFPEELDVPDYLVRSMDFTYEESPIASFITKIHQSGYVLKKDPDKKTYKYTKKSLPPLEFEYSKAELKDNAEVIDPESLRNLPIGLDGSWYQWVDLDSEGISGIFTEQGNAWYFKPNLGGGKFDEMEPIRCRPSTAKLSSGELQLMDIAGDGQLDAVVFSGPMSGFYERTPNGEWEPFRPFVSIPNIPWDNPNLKHVDLNGDGLADILIAEGETFTWYPSLAELGFGQPEKVYLPSDEEKGPRLVFADGTQSVYLADLSGDGLSDLIRIYNEEICYWPNLGYGKFGKKVVMDNSPIFDTSNLFDQRRIRLADIDGSGTTDILYLHHDKVDVYFNECGNRWSDPKPLKHFPKIDNFSSVMTVDLFGNGTACLLWSSSLSGSSSQQMSYIKLMGDQKPHLLVCTKNNMGAETRVEYESSTKFYLEDNEEGTPWVTSLPFPVHVVSRVDTYDQVSRSLFVTQYKYHHGYFDGIEREFRGFGMVEQLDTEQFDTLSKNDSFPNPININAEFHVPPVLTKTWYHTGVYLHEQAISLHMAHEYYGAPEPENKAEFDKYIQTLLEDTILPEKLTAEEDREACRALRGSVLRQEIYALDGTIKEDLPYSISEKNCTVRCLQKRGDNKHAVFFVHPRETLDYHYERNTSDPRISHAMTFEVDDYGNVLKSAAIGYGRLKDDSDLLIDDQSKQNTTLVTYTENKVTNSIDDPKKYPSDYRTPLPCETKTYELTGYSKLSMRYCFDDFVKKLPEGGVQLLFDSELYYEDPYKTPVATGTNKILRIIEHIRTLYRSDTLEGLLQLGKVEPKALPGESYKLAFTPGLFSFVYQRKKDDQNSSEPLLTNSMEILHEDGGSILSQDLKSIKDHDNDCLFPSEDFDDHWWISSGKIYYWPDKTNDPKQELDFATNHFFLPHRFDDPFGNKTLVFYDNDETDLEKNYNLLLTKTIDPLENTVLAQNDYRVLQPKLMTDPNGNRSSAVFDALGMVAGTAVMGKVHELDGKPKGDTLDEFKADVTLSEIQAFVSNPKDKTEPDLPKGVTRDLLKGATSRIIYDIDRFQRCGQPSFAATLIREIHQNDSGGDKSPIQISVTYSDGFGREIQTKVQAEPGNATKREPDMDLLTGGLPNGDIKPGKLILDENGKPKQDQTNYRWVGKGRTVYNNKGKPVKQYEPFFSSTHLFEEEPEMTDIGVTPVLFYDPVERVVATLHPNHTYEKVVFDPWCQKTYDVNDTVTGNPRTDADISGYVTEYFKQEAPDPADWKTWLQQRNIDPLNSLQDTPGLDPEKKAAVRTLPHANTPTVTYFDTFGRPFLTIANNGKDANGKDKLYKTRTVLDIEGNQRQVIDAKDCIVMRYDYDMLGNKIHQASMEAGERWTLNDANGKPIRSWDSRNHQFRTVYDQLRRPTESYMSEGAGKELLVGRTIYGEAQSDPEAKNLRGKAYQAFDQAGVVTSEEYDFKGNLLRSHRQLAKDYKNTFSWPLIVPPDMLEDEIFTSSTTYDALNRPIQIIAPHNNKDGTKINIIQPVYNEANLLECEDVWLEQNSEPDELLNSTTATQHAVKNINYNAKGQRELIEYGNGVITTYEYDPLTFRLAHLQTLRGTEHLQDLFYTYDPAGNIIVIRDDAQQTIYFNGQVVKPDTEYWYDAIYRLIEASGREHIGQASQPHTTWNDEFRVKLTHPNDGKAMRNYFEFYEYDEVGNILSLEHKAEDGNWTRSYEYNEESQTEADKNSNRLSRTIVNPKSENPISEPYTYDIHGNMTSMPHLPEMAWDFKDELQIVNKGGGCKAYYVYDSTGQRVRKVIEQNDETRSERIYVGGYEVYRQYKGNNTGPILERESLHIMDDKQHIALVETRMLDIGGSDPAPRQLIRYQFGNHLGSASLELDEQAQIISYEEYAPYGSSTYQAVRSQTETAKRYRYTGKERDDESGLYYHGARYCAVWLGRWTNCDPIGVADGPCVYMYCSANPIRFHDPSGKNGTPPLPGLIGNDPKVGKLWEQAVVETLGPRFKASNYKEVIEGFQAELSKRVAAKGPGSNKQAGTGINYARESYSAVRTRFGKLAEAAGIDLKGLQVHHTFDELAKNPAGALDTTNLSFQRGNAGTKGSGHNFAHEANDAAEAGIKNPGQHVAADMRARGYKPDVPELSDPHPKSAALDKTPTLDTHAGKAATAESKLLKSGEELGEKALKESGKGLKVAGKLAKAGRHFAAAIPIAGIVLGQASAAHAASQGDYVGAALDEAGNIPVAGDLLDAARGGIAIGEALNEGLGISDLAMEHGERFEKAAKSIGLGEDASRIIGAAGAALSSITVAPTIALKRTIMGWLN